MKTVRAKFRVGFIDPAHGEGPKTIHMQPVYSGSKENEQFFQATPGGQISLYTLNAAAARQFVIGKEYYVDFTPAS